MGRMRCDRYILRPAICSRASDTEATSTCRNPSSSKASSCVSGGSSAGRREGGHASPALAASERATRMKSFLNRFNPAKECTLRMGSSSIVQERTLTLVLRETKHFRSSLTTAKGSCSKLPVHPCKSKKKLTHGTLPRYQKLSHEEISLN